MESDRENADADLAFTCTSGRAHPHVQVHRHELVHTYCRHLHITSFSTLSTPSPSATKKEAWRVCVGSGCVSSSAEDQVTVEDTSYYQEDILSSVVCD